MKSFTKSSYFSGEETWKLDLGGFARSDTGHAEFLADATVNSDDAVGTVLVFTMVEAPEEGKEVAGRHGAVKYLDVPGGTTCVAGAETESVSSRFRRGRDTDDQWCLLK